MMIVNKQLLDWVRSRLRSKGWTVADFARQTRTTRTGWVRILNGETKALSAKAIDDLCQVFELSEIDLYHLAHPDRAMIVRESSVAYSPRDQLVDFVAADLSAHPDHRPAYESIAAAFGYRKER